MHYCSLRLETRIRVRRDVVRKAMIQQQNGRPVVVNGGHRSGNFCTKQPCFLRVISKAWTDEWIGFSGATWLLHAFPTDAESLFG